MSQFVKHVWTPFYYRKHQPPATAGEYQRHTVCEWESTIIYQGQTNISSDNKQQKVQTSYSDTFCFFSRSFFFFFSRIADQIQSSFRDDFGGELLTACGGQSLPWQQWGESTKKRFLTIGDFLCRSHFEFHLNTWSAFLGLEPRSLWKTRGALVKLIIVVRLNLSRISDDRTCLFVKFSPLPFLQPKLL